MAAVSATPLRPRAATVQDRERACSRTTNRTSSAAWTGERDQEPHRSAAVGASQADMAIVAGEEQQGRAHHDPQQVHRRPRLSAAASPQRG